MPTDTSYVYLTDDPNKVHLAWDAFVALPAGTRCTVSYISTRTNQRKEVAFVRAPGPVRAIFLATDTNRSSPITREQLDALPPDTDIIVRNNDREFTSKAGTVFVPPPITMATLVSWARERGSDSGVTNKPADTNSF